MLIVELYISISLYIFKDFFGGGNHSVLFNKAQDYHFFLVCCTMHLVGPLFFVVSLSTLISVLLILISLYLFLLLFSWHITKTPMLLYYIYSY